MLPSRDGAKRLFPVISPRFTDRARLSDSGVSLCLEGGERDRSINYGRGRNGPPVGCHLSIGSHFDAATRPWAPLSFPTASLFFRDGPPRGPSIVRSSRMAAESKTAALH
ncbi:hypothetical protein MRX96_055860 [Rhipicephalus microplus]